MLHEVPICFVGEDPELTGCRNLGPLVDQSPTERGGARATRMRLLHKMSPKIHVEETAVLRILSLPSPSIIAQEHEFLVC